MKRYGGRAVLLLLAMLIVAVFLAGCNQTPEQPQNPGDQNPKDQPAQPTVDRAAQVRNSPHVANFEATEDSPARRDGCMGCHAFNAYAKGVSTAAELGEDPKAADCNTCHDQGNNMALRESGIIKLPTEMSYMAGNGALCIDCHNGRRNPNDPAIYEAFSAPHGGTQGSVLSGTGGFEVEGREYGNSPHTTIEDSCTACHMVVSDSTETINSVGGHTLLMKVNDNQNLHACTPCHAYADKFQRTAYGDYDGDGTLNTLQEEVKGLMEMVKKAAEKKAGGTFESSHGKIIFKNAAGEEMDQARIPREAYRAAYNYFLVNNDKSMGIHNPQYVVQLLQGSYKELTGNEVPNADIR